MAARELGAQAVTACIRLCRRWREVAVARSRGPFVPDRAAGQGLTWTERLRHVLVCGFIAAFLIVLLAPLCWTPVSRKHNQSESLENRKLAVFPDIQKTEWRKLPARFDSYFSDNLGLRRRFLNGYLRLFNSVLQSPVGRYISGNQGELFEKAVIVNALDLDPKTPEYLAMLRATAAGTAAYFFLRDIPYHLFLIPDKSTLYPEWMPFYAGFVQHRGWFADLEAALQSANINFHSMREFFAREKDNIRLYDKIFDNCHWNGDAIKLFYQNIQRFIPKDVYDFDMRNAEKYLQVNTVEIKDNIYGNDSVPIVGFPHSDFLEERTLQFFGKERTGWWEGRFYLNHHQADKAIWMISDSYLLGTHGADILPIFAFNAHRCLHVHFDKFTSDKAEKWMSDHKPDLVIGEFVERMGGLGFSIIQDKRITMLGDVWTNTPGYIVDKNALASAKLVHANLREKNGKMLFEASRDDASIIFPEIITDEYGHAMIMARMRSREDTEACLLYSLEDGASPVLSEATKALPVTKIRKGQNYIHLHIFSKPRARVKLRFVPGKKKGTYTFLPIPEVVALQQKLGHGL